MSYLTVKRPRNYHKSYQQDRDNVCNQKMGEINTYLQLYEITGLSVFRYSNSGHFLIHLCINKKDLALHEEGAKSLTGRHARNFLDAPRKGIPMYWLTHQGGEDIVRSKNDGDRRWCLYLLG